MQRHPSHGGGGGGQWPHELLHLAQPALTTSSSSIVKLRIPSLLFSWRLAAHQDRARAPLQPQYNQPSDFNGENFSLFGDCVSQKCRIAIAARIAENDEGHITVAPSAPPRSQSSYRV
jgi:hypothetical protein